MKVPSSGCPGALITARYSSAGSIFERVNLPYVNMPDADYAEGDNNRLSRAGRSKPLKLPDKGLKEVMSIGKI